MAYNNNPSFVYNSPNGYQAPTQQQPPQQYSQQPQQPQQYFQQPQQYFQQPQQYFQQPQQYFQQPPQQYPQQPQQYIQQPQQPQPYFQQPQQPQQYPQQQALPVQPAWQQPQQHQVSSPAMPVPQQHQQASQPSMQNVAPGLVPGNQAIPDPPGAGSLKPTPSDLETASDLFIKLQNACKEWEAKNVRMNIPPPGIIRSIRKDPELSRKLDEDILPTMELWNKKLDQKNNHESNFPSLPPTKASAKRWPLGQ